MFTSQTDAMLAAKFDPEPWTAVGVRYAHEFPQTRTSAALNQRTFDPRPEFIPSRWQVIRWDGLLVSEHDDFEDAEAASMFWTGSNVVKVERSETSPILVEFRAAEAPDKVSRWLDLLDAEGLRGDNDWSPQMIEHARRVLSHLANLTTKEPA